MTYSTKQYALTEDQRTELHRRVQSSKTSKRDSLRANIILLREGGMKQRDVAKNLGISHTSVSKWTMRFEKQGIKGLKDALGRGRKPTIDSSKLRKVIDQVEHSNHGKGGRCLPKVCII